MSDGGSFFDELKRRNIYKVAVAYLIGAWLLIQAASIFLPTFDAPHWVMKAVITLVISGFPLALFLSWAFEAPADGQPRLMRPSPLLGIATPFLLVAAAFWYFEFRHPGSVQPPSAAALASVSKFVGQWQGVVRYGRGGDTSFDLTVNADASSVVQSSPRMADTLHKATFDEQALTWQAGRMANVHWTLTPNPDGQTAAVVVKGGAGGVMGTATFKRMPPAEAPAAPAKSTAEVRSSP